MIISHHRCRSSVCCPKWNSILSSNPWIYQITHCSRVGRQVNCRVTSRKWVNACWSRMDTGAPTKTLIRGRRQFITMYQQYDNESIIACTLFHLGIVHTTAMSKASPLPLVAWGGRGQSVLKGTFVEVIGGSKCSVGSFNEIWCPVIDIPFSIPENLMSCDIPDIRSQKKYPKGGFLESTEKNGKKTTVKLHWFRRFGIHGAGSPRIRSEAEVLCAFGDITRLQQVRRWILL